MLQDAMQSNLATPYALKVVHRHPSWGRESVQNQIVELDLLSEPSRTVPHATGAVTHSFLMVLSVIKVTSPRHLLLRSCLQKDVK